MIAHGAGFHPAGRGALFLLRLCFGCRIGRPVLGFLATGRFHGQRRRLRLVQRFHSQRRSFSPGQRYILRTTRKANRTAIVLFGHICHCHKGREKRVILERGKGIILFSTFLVIICWSAAPSMLVFRAACNTCDTSIP